MIALTPFDFIPAQALAHEWTVANSLGGYSSSTAIGMNSRKYHGLLVAPLSGTFNRHVMLSKLEETVRIGERDFPISTNSYPGAYFPTGFQNQIGFKFTDHPTFIYSAGGARLEKSVRMVHGKNTVLVSYRLASGRDAKITIRPFLRPRGIHEDPSVGAADVKFEPDENEFSILKPARMRVSCSHGSFEPAPEYYYGMQYETEARRGYPASETLFSPGAFTTRLGNGDELHVCASLEMLSPASALDLLDRQAFRFQHFADSFSRTNSAGRTDFGDSLLRAADSFIIMTDLHRGIIAGYPWFSEWGRDTMISLPGLLLSTGRFPLAREILNVHAARMENGLMPNFIDEGGKAHYNSADASLWFADALRQYAEATGDYNYIRQQMWPALRSMLSSYMRGNGLISMDSDCLLRVSDPAGTWMDARVDGKAVTPRNGKPVEINALWYSTLHFMLELSKRFDDRTTGEICGQAIEVLDSTFQQFLSSDGGLFDTLSPNNPSLRPNQIFAVSLPHSPLNELQQRHVFNLVRSRLYTPLGLRTLTPDDPRFCDKYEGGPRERDSAYHQGAIWPWLLGAFFDAQLRVYPGCEPQVLSALKPFAEAMKQGSVGTIPELYEPATMRAEGALSQAWSVAEVLRIYSKVKKSAAEKSGAALPLRKEYRIRA